MPPRTTFRLLPAVFGLWLLSAASAAAQIELPQGPDRDLVYGNCRTCHDLQYLVDSAGIPADAWDDVVANMRQFGLRIPAEERAKIVAYLGSYLGPNPPKPDAQPAATEPAGTTADGATLFGEQCVACHQADGRGVPGQFPPLAGNGDLYLAPAFPAAVVLNGLQGRIEVAGTAYDGVMPPFDHLSDREIAALVGYVRSAWGNDELRPASFGELTPDAVAAMRAKTLGAEAVHALRAELK
ncbi:sulfite dehydrogenase (cytochrome) subunit SorB [Tistlia consotensis]|uniref:Sulfite dehydrogenase (Cytochrome) subunit SorB n=1 Tax=Tistlia consotensis USBA 355 TaxID=560819 RepID=A0A1Y6CJF0_9PROT|nr:c-type cytochrome [Tistlia consotensis]SMF68944.1 sulfite dehydrogenase (cytochrome) subunit SorB [Tistlia consotensis USBA 355]SNS01646.1 sulfite dehydrogenase (cytochrome) subunit SorB [Tistlia consotensis]